MKRWIKMYKYLNNLKPIKHLVLSVLCVLLAFVIFFPSRFTTIDEHDYLNNAELIVNSGLKTDCSLNIPGQWPTDRGYCISKYNIGTSFFLIPAVIINKDLVAFSTLLVFIAGILIFSKLLKYYKLDERFVYLFALFPPFIFFTRTVLSEMYSMVMLMGLFYAFLNISKSSKYKILAGLFMSLALYIRYTNLIPVGILGVYFLYKYIKEYGLKKFLIKFWITHLIALVAFVSILLFNNVFYGDFFRSGYYFSSEEGAIILEQIPAIFFKYFLLLNIFYPVALIVLFKSKIKDIRLFMSMFLGLLVFYILFKNESFPGKLSDIILGLRFLIPVYPFLLIPYFERINSLKNDKYYRFFLYTSIAALFIVGVLINYLHYKYIHK